MQKKITRILIPTLIVFVIIGIWFIKNKEQKALPILEVENEDFLLETLSLDIDHLKSYGLPILIDFGADSCVPCKEMAPILQELNLKYQNKVIIKFVDVWKNQNLADGFPLEVIPTQFFFTAEGKPFVPIDPEKNQMIMYTSKDTDEHIFTAHQGGLTKLQLESIFDEMGVEK